MTAPTHIEQVVKAFKELVEAADIDERDLVPYKYRAIIGDAKETFRKAIDASDDETGGNLKEFLLEVLEASPWKMTHPLGR